MTLPHPGPLSINDLKGEFGGNKGKIDLLNPQSQERFNRLSTLGLPTPAITDTTANIGDDDKTAAILRKYNK